MGGITDDFNTEAITDGKLNLVTHGSGTSFPATWAQGTRLFWRSDLEAFYYNKGADTTPVTGDWERVDNPIGAVIMYGGDEADLGAGWLICKGQLVSKTTYPELYDRIGTKYGSETTTDFLLPDMQSPQAFPRGTSSDGELGDTDGADTVTLTSSQMPVHQHSNIITGAGTAARNGGAGPSLPHPNVISFAQGPILWRTNDAGGGTSHTNLPVCVEYHFIIAV